MVIKKICEEVLQKGKGCSIDWENYSQSEINQLGIEIYPGDMNDNEWFHRDKNCRMFLKEEGEVLGKQ